VPGPLGATPAIVVIALAASVAGAATPDTPPLAGELTRLDLTRRSISVRLDGSPAREIEADTRPETRLLSRGRTLRLEELHPGDRVLLLVGEESGRRVVRVVKVVGRPAAIAPPSAAPAPTPSAPPPSSGPGG